MKRISTPRRTASLSSQLVDSLRSHIEAGEWPVGTRIPPEQTLIEELGVGRSTLREALGALVHLGLLESRVGDGTYVRASSELQSVMVRRASGAERSNVLELRTVLEEYASGAAALRRSEDQLGQLRELLADADTACAGADMAAARNVDALFHRAVVRASGNDLLVEVYDYLGTALTSALGGLPWDAAGAEEHAGLHRRLVDAIEAQDASAAQNAAASIVHLTREHQTEPPGDGPGRAPAGASAEVREGASAESPVGASAEPPVGASVEVPVGTLAESPAEVPEGAEGR